MRPATHAVSCGDLTEHISTYVYCTLYSRVSVHVQTLARVIVITQHRSVRRYDDTCRLQQVTPHLSVRQ